MQHRVGTSLGVYTVVQPNSYDSRLYVLNVNDLCPLNCVKRSLAGAMAAWQDANVFFACTNNTSASVHLLRYMHWKECQSKCQRLFRCAVRP